MHFFYNHPARGASIRIDGKDLPVCVRQGSSVVLRPDTIPFGTIERVSYFSNDNLVADVSEPPFAAAWKPSTPGLHRLRADILLGGKEIVHSTRNPFLLVSPVSAEGSTVGQSASSLIPIVSARSSANEDSYLEPPRAIDNDFYTRWGSGWSDGQWFMLDLGKPRKVSGVTIFWEIAWAIEYDIELSTDGKTWLRAVRQSDGKGGIETYNFPPTRARYVRFAGVKRGTEWGYSFWEIFVHGE
jgi:hypothetical protein